MVTLTLLALLDMYLCPTPVPSPLQYFDIFIKCNVGKRVKEIVGEFMLLWLDMNTYGCLGVGHKAFALFLKSLRYINTCV